VRPAVKLAVIAREVGVSVSTVSKVLNNRADVAAATRLRVRTALERHGYPLATSPAAGARANAALLDVVIQELNSSWSATLLSGVERAAADRGIGIVVSAVRGSGPGPMPPRRWLDQVAARGTCGVLGILVELSETQVAYLRDAGIPRVVVDPATEPHEDVTTVRLTNRESTRRAVEHLIGLGHLRIGVVSGNPQRLPAQERLQGFREAMTAAGLPQREEWERSGGFDRSASLVAAREILSAPERPTALVFASDQGALAGYAVAGQLGLRVPDDVSIIGFDDVPEASAAVPGLTTVRQPVAAMVEAAMAVIERPPTPHGERIECGAELVVRGSTAAPAVMD
jgi:DNA-binding LacI/PurR family transcriptional regulator